jgi:hypothetical protein
VGLWEAAGSCRDPGSDNAGIVKGGEWTANKIQEHGQKQKAKMVPNERPMEISRPIQSGAKGVNQASKMVDTTAKKVSG